MIECPECEGRGSWLETVSVCGEALDADQWEVFCDLCDGSGEIESDDE